MGYVNKGSLSATAVVSADPDLSGNYVCNGTNDEVEINQAIADLELISPNEVSLLIKPGQYNIYDHINADGCDSKDMTTFAYGARFFLANGRPDTVSGDWPFHVILLQQDAALTNWKWFGGEFDANKANQTIVNANTGISAIYMRHSGNNVVFRDVWVHDHILRGIMTKAISGDYYDVHYTYCKGHNNNFDDLKFAISGVHNFYGSSINNCKAGGDTGDLGIDLFDQDADGFFYDIQICNNIVYRMFGTEGSGPGHTHIRNETVSERILIGDNTLLDVEHGISDHAQSPNGRNLIVGNLIKMDDTYTETDGIIVRNPNTNVTGNYVYGELRSGEVLYLIQDGNQALLSGNYANNGTVGFRLIDATFVSLVGNYSTNCTTGVRINGGSDGASIRGHTFADTMGLLLNAGADNIIVSNNDFDQCTDDVDDSSGGGTIRYGYNRDKDGNWDEGIEP